MTEDSAANMTSTSIHSAVDFARQGKHLGYLRLPHSVHRSAYGWLPIPVASIRNGTGPKVMVMAGNHGDEYEGQILVSSLIRDVDADMISGQLILLPMANFPAAEAGLRTSPIDDANLNRIFPGDRDGTPSHVIADFIERILLAGADYLFDLHSGGSSLTYLPSALASEGETPDAKARIRELTRAFGLPNTILFPREIGGSNSDAAALRHGAMAISTELGGGGTVTPSILSLARAGLLHLLGHVGVLNGPLVPTAPPGDTRVLTLDNPNLYVYAPEPGLYEPLVELGDNVGAGQPACRIHFTETPGKAPITVPFDADGVVLCKRIPARCRRGDCLFHMARPTQ